MPPYFFRSEPGAAELRRLARRESGRVCQRVLMIANMLEGMEHEAAARLAGLSRSAAYEWHNRYEEDGIEGLRDRPRPGRQPRVDAVTSTRFKERIVAGAGGHIGKGDLAIRRRDPLQDAHLHCAIGTSVGNSEARLPQPTRQAARQYRPRIEGLRRQGLGAG